MSYPPQPGPSAPDKHVSGRTIALVAAGFAAVGALIIGLIVGLSSGDDEDGTTRVTLIGYKTGYSATVSVRVPAGWQLFENPQHAGDALLVRSTKPMTLQEFTSLTEGLMRGTETARPLEVVSILFSACPGPDSYNAPEDSYNAPEYDAEQDGWQIAHPVVTDPSHNYQLRTGSLLKVVGDDLCLEVESSDKAPAGITLPDGAEKLLEKVRDGQVITEVRLLPNAGASTSPSDGR